MKKVTDKERKDNNVYFERHIQRYEKHIVTKEKKNTSVSRSSYQWTLPHFSPET